MPAPLRMSGTGTNADRAGRSDTSIRVPASKASMNRALAISTAVLGALSCVEAWSSTMPRRASCRGSLMMSTPLTIVGANGRVGDLLASVGGGKDTLVGRDDEIPESGEGPILVSAWRIARSSGSRAADGGVRSRPRRRELVSCCGRHPLSSGRAQQPASACRNNRLK